MSAEDTRPVMNLTNALQAAVGKDDLDDACRILQDTLGVTDGGLAGACFSDLDNESAPNGPTWSKLSVAERRNRLVSYLKSEIDLMQDVENGPQLTLTGFSPWHTGGGCMALARHLPDGSYWLVTGDDGTSIPCEGDRIFVGYYGSDGETIIFEGDCDWSGFDRDAFLARVAASERPGDSCDPDAMTDANERRASVEEQEEAQEVSFQEFQNSRRQMSSREFGRIVGDATWEDEPERQFLVYNDQWWIEIAEDGRHLLVLENRSWMSGNDRTLEDLERELFAYAQDS